ncbi:MAG: AMP-binding protein [Myxococcota bacterium]
MEDAGASQRLAFADATAAARVGMSLSHRASLHPERDAIRCEHGDRTFAALNARANRLLRALRARGLRAGDGVAIVSRNRPEFAEAFFACLRGGLRFTPVNWHGSEDEIAYVVADCEARALVCDAAFAPAAARAREAAGARLDVRLAVGGALDAFEPFEDALAPESGDDVEDASLGDTMLYTSGTTGRPKGVRRAPPEPDTAAVGLQLLIGVFDFRADAGDVSLATGPLYHSGPLNLCLNAPLSAGVPVVLMDKWDARRMLALLERHGVTHTFCVPTMFHRLLALPEGERRACDTSRLRFVIHGAAPTPVEDKRRMIEWLGPILTEIFASTEGPGTFVSSQEWLARPGTVGRPAPGAVRILDERGAELPPGEVGVVHLRAAPGASFEYFKDAEKTRAAQRDGFYTVGDVGYLDDEGYLFLTGRSAELAIVGGTNVYPAEIDDVLLLHDAVEDAAAFGVPSAEWGEEIEAIVALAPDASPGDALAEALRAHCRERLPTIKIPRRIAFVERVPRSEAGKVLRRRIRDERLAQEAPGGGAAGGAADGAKGGAKGGAAGGAKGGAAERGT